MSAPAEGNSLIELLLERSTESANLKPPPGGLTVGTLRGFGENGQPQVEYSGQSYPAGSVIPLTTADLGADVVLGFENGDAARPIVLGRLWVPETPAAKPSAMRVEADGERVVVSAEREIVLQCGEASITLTSAGKVLIRGTYLLSRSSGANRIKGGSVQVN